MTKLTGYDALATLERYVGALVVAATVDRFRWKGEWDEEAFGSLILRFSHRALVLKGASGGGDDLSVEEGPLDDVPNAPLTDSADGWFSVPLGALGDEFYVDGATLVRVNPLISRFGRFAGVRLVFSGERTLIYLSQADEHYILAGSNWPAVEALEFKLGTLSTTSTKS